ncbi:MAG: hypothetical protein A4E57_00859 [Syntrophorhabdaceae bacterium PtaU1.Bin034]|nr:MAG: hypothetical protein A4E57_00859 [Syntrophorhabdaceae bacterium PtaU1.Bin034]
MPFGDRTGPRGFGPVTGRGAGYCAGYPVPGYAHYGQRRAFGGGRGRRNHYYATGLAGWQRGGGGWVGAGGPYNPMAAPVGTSAPVDPELQLSTLKAQADNLTRTLEAIKEKIETWEARNRKGGQ